ncbi:MAG TPA: hypothetical protein VHW44_33240 [Pseudonocardiaceae bacterium]|nr:hypothetical protein [Pseudonocardiaceae bacterium]
MHWRLPGGFLACLIILEDRRRWITDLEVPRRDLLPAGRNSCATPPETLPVTPLANPA